MGRNEGKIYFASDVHLGLDVNDNSEREERFVNFLKSINTEDTRALYLLGDIWDFWYEYRDVIPRDGIRTTAALIDLIDNGVEVFFFPGNHDIWCYSFFESIGIKKLSQPYYVELNGKAFCLGHGDGLGGSGTGFRILQKIFHCRMIQRIFSTLHPWLAFRFGKNWSKGNRSKHAAYTFNKANSHQYKFAVGYSESKKVDFFILGHLHRGIDLTLDNGARFIVLKDWIDGGSPYAVFNGTSVELHS